MKKDSRDVGHKIKVWNSMNRTERIMVSEEAVVAVQQVPRGRHEFSL